MVRDVAVAREFCTSYRKPSAFGDRNSRYRLNPVRGDVFSLRLKYFTTVGLLNYIYIYYWWQTIKVIKRSFSPRRIFRRNDEAGWVVTYFRPAVSLLSSYYARKVQIERARKLRIYHGRKSKTRRPNISRVVIKYEFFENQTTLRMLRVGYGFYVVFCFDEKSATKYERCSGRVLRKRVRISRVR